MANFKMDAEAGKYTVQGNTATLTHEIIKRTIEKNWSWIAIYIVTTIVGIVASYLVSGWVSVGISFGGAIITLVVGYLMLTRVIIITREER